MKAFSENLGVYRSVSKAVVVKGRTGNGSSKNEAPLMTLCTEIQIKECSTNQGIIFNDLFEIGTTKVVG